MLSARPGTRVRAGGPPGLSLDPVMTFRLNIRNLSHGPLESPFVPAPGALSQVFLGHQGRDLFGQCQRDQVIDGHLFSLSQLAYRLVQRVRKPKTDGAHGSSPIFCRNSFAVVTWIPSLSAPRKSLWL